MKIPTAEEKEQTQKELRFLRTNQAIKLFLIGGGLLSATLTIFLIGILPDTFSAWWATLPLLIATIPIYIAWSCLQHPYIILSPLGFEFFPLNCVEEDLQIIAWREIDHHETHGKERTLTLHLNTKNEGKIQEQFTLSLTPLDKTQRKLLLHAVEQRLTLNTNT